MQDVITNSMSSFASWSSLTVIAVMKGLQGCYKCNNLLYIVAHMYNCHLVGLSCMQVLPLADGASNWHSM